MQKAEVVELVKHQVGAITLAIGDGAKFVETSTHLISEIRENTV